MDWLIVRKITRSINQILTNWYGETVNADKLDTEWVEKTEVHLKNQVGMLALNSYLQFLVTMILAKIFGHSSLAR